MSELDIFSRYYCKWCKFNHVCTHTVCQVCACYKYDLLTNELFDIVADMYSNGYPLEEVIKHK